VPVLVATIVPKAEHRDEVLAALRAAIPRVHAEDEGCHLYALHEAPGKFVMIEDWESAAALAAHGASPALVELTKRLAGLTEGGLDIVLLDPVPIGDPAKGQLRR
jgi:quinol monooxygenase YgiN